MDEATLIQSAAVTAESSAKTMIDMLREEYHHTMNLIDVQSSAEIKSGQEMKGIMTFMVAANKLKEIHELLSTFYCGLFHLSELLKRNDSQRLKQLGHDMLPTLEVIRSLNGTDEMKDQLLVNQFHEIGLRKQHWYFKERFLLEIEYMLDSLSILIEPDFMPISTASDSSTEENVDRYISSEVKLKVWRRDQGKCVECGSKEKLEYDHIIPFSRGGSNTERNIQLLCQSCNRNKAAAIQ